MCTCKLVLELWKPCGLRCRVRSSKSLRTDTRSYAVDCDDVDNDANVEVAGVGNAKINLEFYDVDGYVDVGLQGTDMHMVDVDVADAEDVNVDDVDDVAG